MARDFAKAFYNSKEWKNIRKAYIASRFGICQRCGRSNAKQVHHKEYLNESNINDPSVSLDFNNFELLCDICHQKEHNEKYSPTLWGLGFDECGDLIKTEETQ